MKKTLFILVCTYLTSVATLYLLAWIYDIGESEMNHKDSPYLIAFIGAIMVYYWKLFNYIYNKHINKKTMNLLPEQLAYLKNLESPKKRRKFMLDCLVNNVLGESVKFTIDKGSLKEGDIISFTATATTAPRTFEGILNNEQFQLPSDVIQRSVDLGLEGLRAINEAYEMADKFKNDESANKETQHLESGDFDFNFSLVNAMKECADKSNYTPEEVDMAKNLMTEREKFAENVKKIDEKKWTDEDMEKCFNEAMFVAIDGCREDLLNPKKLFLKFLEELKNHNKNE